MDGVEVDNVGKVTKDNRLDDANGSNHSMLDDADRLDRAEGLLTSSRLVLGGVSPLPLMGATSAGEQSGILLKVSSYFTLKCCCRLRMMMEHVGV